MTENTTTRRGLLKGALGAAVAGSMGLVGWLSGEEGRPSGVTLRPPGALGEEAFLAACTRCFKCSSACPNDCIDTFDLRAGLGKAFTPYIKARTSGCVLCGECAAVCPTGALKPFVVSREGWLTSVAMGTARVNKEMCFSYHGRTCGACYQACPLAGMAMKIGVFETPIVIAENDGVLVTGKTVLNAFDRLEVLEYTAEAIIYSRPIGGTSPMSDEAIRELEDTFPL